MTAPVTAAAPAARTAPATSTAGGSGETAAPFASALDGALAGGVRDAGAEGREHPSGQAPDDQTAAAEEQATAPVVATGAAAVAAGLWALLRGATATPPAEDAAGPAVAASAAATSTAPAVTAPALTPTGTVDPAGAAPAPGAPAAPTAGPVPGTPAAGRPGPELPATASTRAAAATTVIGDGAEHGRAAGRAETPGIAVVADTPAASRKAGAQLPAAAGTSVATPATGTPGLPVAGAPAAAVGGQQASGDPGTGREGAAGVAPVPAVEAEVPPAVTGAPAPAPAPLPATGAATGTGAATPVSAQVSRQVALLSDAGTGSHTMTLVLTPENLGPVQLQVTVAEGVLDLTLRGAHELGRAALLEALPELRRDLEAAGLSPSRVEVDADAGGSWLSRHAAEQQARQDTGSRGGSHEPAGGWSRPGGRPADSGEGRAAPQNRSTSSGVDVRV
ncbi:flagellar hook-length control protein FliK [Blastococcus sp. SYSU DS0533]